MTQRPHRRKRDGTRRPGTVPFLQGPRLYLRPLEAADLNADYLGWLNDHDVTRYLETGRFPVTIEDLRAYLARFRLTARLAFHEAMRDIRANMQRKTASS